jgi:ATP-dependent exoDNAse (exonuclease V) alpha subunit
MASFYLQISSVGRGAGRRATAAAAYRAGERIRDDRSGELLNHTGRRDVLHTEIFLPRQFDGAAIAWARTRERLWNTAEHAEKRHNAKVAREYQVNLPPELNAAQRLSLARAFSQEIAERYKVAVDLAVHEPRPGGDPRNFHAHLLTTTREVTPAGLGAKAGLDLSALERRRRELPDHRQEYVNVRERWASLTNEALREAHVTARVDHRSLAAQGVDREPQPRIPLMHLKMEQRGVRSELAERLRADYRERLERRTEHIPERREAGITTERVEAARTADQARATGSAALPATRPTDAEEIRRQAREAWLRLRAGVAQKPLGGTRETTRAQERAADGRDVLESEAPVRDDDLAL